MPQSAPCGSTITTIVERGKVGVRQLAISPLLQEACDIRTKELITKYSHTRPNGDGFNTVVSPGTVRAYLHENIAWTRDPNSSPARVMKMWMNRPGHRENLLLGQHTIMGIGVAQKGTTTYWVQLFSLER